MNPNELLDEIDGRLQIPRGVALILTERAGSPNWNAGSGLMPLTKTAKFHAIVAELRKSAPRVEWSGVSTHFGTMRRVTRHGTVGEIRHFGRRPAAAA